MLERQVVTYATGDMCCIYVCENVLARETVPILSGLAFTLSHMYGTSKALCSPCC